MLGGIPDMRQRFGMGGSPMTGGAGGSFDQMNGGGMDVMGSLQKHSDFATQYQSNPAATPFGASGGIFDNMNGFGGF